MMIFDGLYYIKKWINWIRSQGKDVLLIKTTEKNLTHIQDAEELFGHYEEFKDEVEYYEGTQVREDGEKFSYQLWAVGELTAEGVDYPLKVAKVKTVNLINKQEETSYLITTHVELTGLEMKEIGQLRYFRCWRQDETMEKLHTALRQKVRKESGRDAQPGAGIIDSQSVKTTEVSGQRGYDAGKKIKGRKRHILVDTMGLVLMVVYSRKTSVS